MASDFFKLRDHLRNYYIGMKWVRSCSCREDSGSGVGGYSFGKPDGGFTACEAQVLLCQPGTCSSS